MLWKFAHPKDLQDGLVEITENDCLANVPFVPGCGLWFDHHSSEFERQELEGKYKGESRITPSCARIIYYGGKEKFPNFDDIMEAVDKVDSGNLTVRSSRAMATALSPGHSSLFSSHDRFVQR